MVIKMITHACACGAKIELKSTHPMTMNQYLLSACCKECLVKIFNYHSMNWYPKTCLGSWEISKYSESADIHTMRSGYERDVKEGLQRLGVSFQYEAHAFAFPMIAGNPIRYVPDFYIPRARMFIEVKGKIWSAHDRRKVQLLDGVNGVTVKVIDPTNIGWFRRISK